MCTWGPPGPWALGPLDANPTHGFASIYIIYPLGVLLLATTPIFWLEIASYRPLVLHSLRNATSRTRHYALRGAYVTNISEA
jgi:hypothetical protein